MPRSRALPAGLLLAGGLLFCLTYLVYRPLSLDIGGPVDDNHTQGFYQREVTPDGATYRWSSGASSLILQGAGIAPFTVALQASSGREAGSPPLPITVTAQGQLLTVLTLTNDSRLYTITVPAGGVNALSGDLVLDFRSPTHLRPRDSRQLGFIVDFVRVTPVGPVLPAPGRGIYLLLSVGLLYALVRRLGWRGWVALIVAGGLALGITGVLVAARLLVTVYSARLLALLVLAHIMLTVVAWGTRALAHWVLPQRLWPVTHPAWRLLLSLFTVALLLKAGGLLYPHSFIVDADFHLRVLNWLVTDQFPDQHTLAFLVMPADEWKQRVFIPYSPFFYYAFAPLTWLPLPVQATVPLVAALLDVLRIPLVFLLALRLGPGLNRALAAAAVFTFLPATYVLQQWGNWPTQISLWLTLAWLTALALAWERLHRPLPFALVSGLLGLALLSYTVTAGYIGLIFGPFAILGFLFSRPHRRSFGALLLTFVAGIALALVVFYGAYVGEFLTLSIPTLLGATADTGAGAGGSVTTRTGGVPGFLTDSVGKAIQSYGLAPVFGLGLAGFGLALSEWWTRRGAPGGVRPARPAWAFGLMTAWLISLPLFTAADYVVDQALKEYWFALPAIAVLAGAWLLRLARRGRAGAMLVGLLSVVLVWNSLSLWIFRLLLHNR
jgi:hypothetical protein